MKADSQTGTLTHADSLAAQCLRRLAVAVA